jgi:hypothetical protein
MSTDHIETPDEIEASLRKREEMFLQWAKSREAANMVTKSTPSTQRTHDMSAEWRAYIDATAKKAEQRAIDLTIEVVGEALGESLKKLRTEFESKLESELMKLRNEFLQDRLDEARGVKRIEQAPANKALRVVRGDDPYEAAALIG